MQEARAHVARVKQQQAVQAEWEEEQARGLMARGDQMGRNQELSKTEMRAFLAGDPFLDWLEKADWRQWRKVDRDHGEARPLPLAAALSLLSLSLLSLCSFFLPLVVYSCVRFSPTPSRSL